MMSIKKFTRHSTIKIWNAEISHSYIYWLFYALRTTLWDMITVVQFKQSPQLDENTNFHLSNTVKKKFLTQIFYVFVICIMLRLKYCF